MFELKNQIFEFDKLFVSYTVIIVTCTIIEGNRFRISHTESKNFYSKISKIYLKNDESIKNKK